MPGNGGLGSCLENILKDYDVEDRAQSPATVESVDAALQQLATRCHFSSLEVQASATGPSSNPDDILKPIYLKLNSSETKWMTRLVLKNLTPIVLEENLVFARYHFLLPGLLKFQDSLSVATGLLRGPLSRYPSSPDKQSRAVFVQDATQVVAAQVGVKVGRPPFLKARSFDHCIKMTHSKRWSIERKYDGEYCEVHLNLENPEQPIRIFSKAARIPLRIATVFTPPSKKRCGLER